jgi:hypothetical protein
VLILTRRIGAWNAFVFRDAVKPVPGGCGQHFVFCTRRKTNIVPLSVRATLLDTRHCRRRARYRSFAARTPWPDRGDF